jgi:hypothetical protein
MAQPTPWRIGYAESEITPAPGQAFMAGFGVERHATGALAPLMAQALSIGDRRGKTALLLTADILGFDLTTVEYVRRQIKRKYGLKESAVMFAASHTHWGPAVFYRGNFSIGAPNPWYIRRLEEALLQVAQEAMENAGGAQLGYTSLEVRLGHNRRLISPEGKVLWAVNVQGGYDTHTPVIVVARKKSPRRIVLVGHACHPTGSGNIDKWSPDYPGAMRDAIGQRLGKDSAAMFVMGCGADVKVTHKDAKTGEMVFSANPARSRAAGRKLASAVVKGISEDTLIEVTGNLRMNLVRGKLSFDRRPQAEVKKHAYDGDPKRYSLWWGRQMINFPDERRALDYHVQAWRFGDVLTLVGLEGEVCSPLGPVVRSLVKTPEAAVIAYANAACGYIPTCRILREGGYEGEGAHRAYFCPGPFTSKVEEQFKKIVRKAVAGVE